MRMTTTPSFLDSMLANATVEDLAPDTEARCRRGVGLLSRIGHRLHGAHVHGGGGHGLAAGGCAGGSCTR